MRLFTSEEMKIAETHAIEKIGIPSIVLMENAGIKSLLTIEKIVSGVKGKRFTIICGKGNNGGDGLVIARHLHNNAVPVHLFLLSEPEELSPDSEINCRILIKSGLYPSVIKEKNDIDKLRVAMEFSECIIDCIYGTGIKANIKGLASEIVKAVNLSRAIKISIDLPSGVCGTTGKASVPSIISNYTITLGTPKIGLFMYPGLVHAGEVWTADIGIPSISNSHPQGMHYLIDDELAFSLLPYRDENIHKGLAGKVLVFGGSSEYQGAGIMASGGALRSGAGIINLALPDCLMGKIICQIPPEVIVSYLPSRDGGFFLNESTAINLCSKYNAILVGPGWGRGEGRRQTLEHILNHYSGIVVIDADALNIISQSPELLANRKCRIIITPHHAEMARLCKTDIEDIANNQIARAKDYAADNKVTVVLKSSVTVIAAPNGKIFINSAPNSGMAKGGSGDLLSGFIAGLAATGGSELNAAITGVYIISEAGKEAKEQLGCDSMSVSEVSFLIPKVFSKLRNKK